MVCKNCGEKLRSNEKFCTVCGYYNDDEGDLLENKEQEKKQEFKEEIAPEAEEIEETENQEPNENLMEVYIGEDYKWVMEKPFNIYALLFSWMYFLYRKLYLTGIIGLVITGIILEYVPAIVIPYIVLSMVGSGIFFNKLYIKIVERKVKAIEKDSLGLDSETIERKCKRRGGVTVIIPLVILFAFLIVLIYLKMDVKITDENQRYWKENGENKANCKSMSRQAYNALGSNNVPGTIEEAVCSIELSDRKSYNIYLKVSDKAQYQYILFTNEVEGYLEMKGNTEEIKELEASKEVYGLSTEYEEFLQTSKELASKYESLKDDAEYEDKQIKANANTREKTHFVFTKDDILN